MAKDSPLQIDGWDTPHPLVTILAKLAVVGAEAIHGTMEMLRTGTHLANLPPLPPVADWLKMYRGHKQLREVLLDGWFPSGDPTFKISKFVDALSKQHRASCRKSPEERKAIFDQTPEDIREKSRQFYLKLGQEISVNLSQFIRDDIAGHPDLDPKSSQRIWHTTEMQFFFRVWMPCIFVYGPTPVQLISKARRGDTDAICDLVRLDKMAIAEPRIARHFAAAYATKRRAAFNRIAKALASPSKSLKLPKVKTLLAGYISKIASAAGFPMDSPEIRDLFNRVRHDYGRGYADPDIAAGEVFTKRVQRGRKYWQGIPDAPPEVDKNRA